MNRKPEILKSYFRIIILLFVSMQIASCSKSERDLDTTTNSAVESAFAEEVLAHIIKYVHPFSLTEEIFEDSTHRSGLNLNCIEKFHVSTNQGTYPMILNFDFGKNNNNVCSDGLLRNGRLQAIYTNPFGMLFSKLIISMDSFQLGENLIQGEISLKLDLKGDTNKFEFEVDELSLINDSLNFVYRASRNLLWLEGNDKNISNDDTFLITGNSAGKGSKGNAFTNQIESPITFNYDCDHVRSGTIKHAVSNLSIRNIDFSSENNCTKKVDVSIAGRVYSYEIMLK